MSILEKIDFVFIREMLVEKCREIESLGRIKNFIDCYLVSDGFFDEHLSVQIRKVRGDSNLVAKLMRSPQSLAVISIVECLKDIGVIEFSEQKEEHRGYKTRYFKINDERSDLEVLSDLLPDLPEMALLSLIKISNADGDNKMHQIARIWEEIDGYILQNKA